MAIEMLALQQIKSTSDKYFESLIKLFENSFPPDERREIEDITRLIFACDKMIFNAIVEADTEILCGLMIYWNLGDFYYLEYLAVFPGMRNKKIGENALGLLKEITNGKTLILEVEPGDNDLAIRRIDFYRRNGFRVLDKNYLQPPYAKGKQEVPLWIMGITDENEKTCEFVERMKKSVYPKLRFT